MPFNIKSINLIRKYPHINSIVWLYSIIICYYIFVSNDFLNFFWMCSTPKLSKYMKLLLFTYKAIQWVLISSYSSRVITYVLLFKLNTIKFKFIMTKLLFQDLLKNEVALKKLTHSHCAFTCSNSTFTC